MMERIDLLVYTRKAIKGSYNQSMGNSVHFAWAQEGKPFTALNKNYGIVYPSADISLENQIVEKGIVKPYIFTIPSGGFGILAVRVNKDGTQDDGKIVFWQSSDLIHFTEQVIPLGTGNILEIEALIGSSGGKLHVDWLSAQGKTFTSIIDLELRTVFSHEPREAFDVAKTTSTFDIEGASPGNVIRVGKESIHAFVQAWSPVESVAVLVPESICVNSKEELDKVKVTVAYSDGSTHLKPVIWDTDTIDFKTAKAYTVSGTVAQDVYPFPLAIGYADPVIFQWDGKYYFISTNDNTHDVGIFVREAQSVPALFEKGFKEAIILDFNEEKDFIQTFWAPEFHIIGGELYILFAIGGKVWGPQSHMMRLKQGGSIIKASDWEEPIRVMKQDGHCLTTAGITLDMTYFKANGSSYLVWSYRMMKPLDSGSMMYIAKTDENAPWKLISEPILLSRPLYGWENNDGTINNEGPYPLILGDTIFLAYTGGAAGGYTYAMGFLIANIHDDLLNPKNWQKTNASVLSSGDIAGEFGPGHNAFFVDRNGDIINTYHAQQHIEDRNPRCSAMRRVHLGKNGMPLLNLSNEQDLRPNLKRIQASIHMTNNELSTDQKA